MVFFFLINAMPTLLFLCLCTLLGIWLAFGRTHLFIRMPAFLVGTLALGLALCFTAVDTHPSRFILCLGDSGRALAYGCGGV